MTHKNCFVFCCGFSVTFRCFLFDIVILFHTKVMCHGKLDACIYAPSSLYFTVYFILQNYQFQPVFPTHARMEANVQIQLLVHSNVRAQRTMEVNNVRKVHLYRIHYWLYACYYVPQFPTLQYLGNMNKCYVQEHITISCRRTTLGEVLQTLQRRLTQTVFPT